MSTFLFHATPLPLTGVLRCSEPGIDYVPSADITTVGSVANPLACRPLCQHHATCASFTYNHNDQICILKSANTGTSDVVHATSGPKTCGCIEADTAYTGNDLAGGLVTGVSTAEVCQWHCQQEPRCSFFDYSTDARVGSNGSRSCQMKTGVGNKEAVTGAIAGPIICP